MKNKMNIKEIELLLPDYITGSLDKEEQLKVENALASSSSLEELYLEMKGALDYAGSVQAEEPAPQYFNSLLPRIHERMEAKKRSKPVSSAWKILLPAAAVVLIFIIYRISYTPHTEISQKEQNKITNEKIESKDTAVKKIETPPEVEQKKTNENLSDIRPHNVKRRVAHQDENTSTKTNATKGNEKRENIGKEIQESDDFASVAEVDDYSIFGAGVPGSIDEETADELDQLSGNEQNDLLETLSKSNL